MIFGAISLALPALALLTSVIAIVTGNESLAMGTAFFIVPGTMLLALITGVITVVLALRLRARTRGQGSGRATERGEDDDSWAFALWLGIVGALLLPILLFVLAMLP